MGEKFGIPSWYGLEKHGLSELNREYWNLGPSALVEQIVRRDEGMLGHLGAVIVNTLPNTGRSPNDKFIVKDPAILDDPIDWGKVNHPMTPENFDRLAWKVAAYLQGRDVFVHDLLAGAHPKYRLPIRIITDLAWQSLFARNLFLRIPQEEYANAVPEFTLISVPGLHASPETDGTKSGVFIAIHFGRKLILVGGTRYAGEVKKAIFSIMNYLLPLQGVMAMHCSANVGEAGDVALFFGLSGTGKTTLSSDHDRKLIGDDEHGWGEDGIFNFEGGCYAKTIRLRKELEPLIYDSTRRFGAVLENVYIDPVTRKVDFSNGSLTENTRAAYPIDYVPNSVVEGRGGQPTDIFFLTADASGVLPPLARLTPEQAMYYFLSGYTSKLAGTEKELALEPQATFSTCFAAPFLPLHPNVYARLLGEKIASHQVRVWLINTGWTGGPYGIGKRIYLPHTRAMVRAALTCRLDDIPTRIDPHFGLEVPLECPDVPPEVLNPRQTWSNPEEFDRQAQKLASRFVDNFAQYAGVVSPEVMAAGPRVQVI
ncbi:MAG: phosphoenolpyruvate carboxykinase (ATP) [Anaerolineaceae bacterium]|nr:phosphoenolpyruvate carboxykinase (ATP) [Anaerolineaceae bacterium]